MQTLHSHSLHGRPSAGPGRVSQKQLQHPKHAMHLLGGAGGQQRQRLLGLTRVEPSSTSSTSTNAHRSAVSLHQRQGGSPDHSHHGQHVSHHHRQLRDDGSLKIIMLLSLSLTLLLLPWVSHHPEFLIAPFVLAVTPVVGNGVRPVLKEVAAGFVTTLRLMGMAAWFDITHELPPGQQHQHNHGHLPNCHSSSISGGVGPPQPQQQQFGRDAYQQQQQQQAYAMKQQQQQQPRPSGPHSPWPNPAYMPADWVSAQQQQSQQQPSAAAAAAAAASPLSHPIAADESVDVDWTPRSPLDPHRGDPNSLQHLRQVLAADLLTEAELGQQQRGDAGAAAAAAAATAGSGSSAGARSGSPPRARGSPVGSPALPSSPAGSYDAGDYGAQQQQPSMPHRSEQQQQQQQQQQSRDPRVLSKEAKQQLYQNHHSHLHQQPQQGGGGGGSSGSGSG